MSYHQQWGILAARIHALTKAGELYGQLRASNDVYSVYKLLAQQCQRILTLIEQYQSDFQDVLPDELFNCFSDFFSGNDGRNVAVIREKPSKSSALYGLVALSALESEVSFLLSDKQEQIFARSERAFMHLQRLLVVDDTLRGSWRSAFEESGETKCEKLGAVHLLWHGIFASKRLALPARLISCSRNPLRTLAIDGGLRGSYLPNGNWAMLQIRQGALKRRAAKRNFTKALCSLVSS